MARKEQGKVARRRSWLQRSRVDKRQEHWDKEFTGDLPTSNGKTLYVVLDACNAEGMINLWEIPRNTRLNLQIILFSASHSEISTYPRIYTPSFVRKAEIGKPVNTIADEILREINE